MKNPAVIPAKAGIQRLLLQIQIWIPAFAGMTMTQRTFFNMLKKGCWEAFHSLRLVLTE